MIGAAGARGSRGRGAPILLPLIGYVFVRFRFVLDCYWLGCFQFQPPFHARCSRPIQNTGEIVNHILTLFGPAEREVLVSLMEARPFECFRDGVVFQILVLVACIHGA